MRFLFLASRDWAHPEAAGGDFYLSQLARNLAKKGHGVVYLTAAFNGGPALQRADNVEFRRIKPGTLYSVRLFLQFLTIRNSVDIIVEEVFGGKKIPAFAVLYSGKRLVAVWYQCHKRIFKEQYPAEIANLLSIGEKVLALIYKGHPVVTLSTKSALELKDLGISPARIGIVPSAALIESPKVDELPPFQNRDDSMIFIGKIRRYKRVDHAIVALRRILDSQRECRLIIAGNVAEDDIDYFSSLKELARGLGVDGLIDFIVYRGAIPPLDKVNLLQQCKILVQPSPVEGFSMTAIEANGCGTPVVVSDGVPKDAVVHGGNGFVYPFGDVETMARYCKTLLDDQAIWEKLSFNGLEMANRFSWENSTRAFESFLESQGLWRQNAD